VTDVDDRSHHTTPHHTTPHHTTPQPGGARREFPRRRRRLTRLEVRRRWSPADRGCEAGRRAVTAAVRLSDLVWARLFGGEDHPGSLWRDQYGVDGRAEGSQRRDPGRGATRSGHGLVPHQRRAARV
jgi:hypothetical protein